MLKEYAHIFSDKAGVTDLVEHEVRLTTEEPVRTKSYPIPCAMRDTINAEVQDFLEIGVIEASNSPYNSPPVMIKKKDGTYHCCLDFRNLNKVTLFDVEPMPQPEDIFAKMSKDTYFSKLDFCTGYHQIKMAAKEKKKLHLLHQTEVSSIPKCRLVWLIWLLHTTG